MPKNSDLVVSVEGNQEYSLIHGLNDTNFAVNVNSPEFTVYGNCYIGMESMDTDPDSCVDLDDHLWVAWVRSLERGSELKVVRIGPSGKSEELTLGDPGDVVSSPRVVFDGSTNSAYLIWLVFKEGLWKCIGAELHTDQESNSLVVTAKEEIYSSVLGLRAPALQYGTNLAVAFEVQTPENRVIAYSTKGPQGWKPSQLVNEPNGDCYRPSLAWSSDNETLFLSYDVSKNGSYSIRLISFQESKEQNRMSVNKTDLFSFHSTLAVDGSDRLWIAYASNFRADREGDLVKWNRLYHVAKNGKVWRPRHSQPDVEMDAALEDQGWEFPSLIEDDHGRIWMFGRSSHSFHAQYYGPSGWSERIPFTSQFWGTRGQRISLNKDSKGNIFIVFCGPKFIEIHKLILAPLEGSSSSGITREQLLEVQEADYVGQSSAVKRHPRLRPTMKNIAGTPEQYKLYFGDLHSHSYHSDGTGEVDEFFTRSRDLLNNDFAALTDHEYFCRRKIAGAPWAEMCQIVQSFNKDDAFIAFPGYEWTGAVYPGPGHKHVIFPYDYPPLFSKTDPAYNNENSDQLIEAVGEAGGIAIPHHTGWAGSDYENHDPKTQPIFEMCSCHGANEFYGDQRIPLREDRAIKGHFIVDLYDKGLRFGLCGGSDSHGLFRHHGASWLDDTSRSGLTAVYAKELTRQGIWEGLKSKRTYATSGVPIHLLYTVNGFPMGSELNLKDNKIDLHILVQGCAPLESVELMVNGKTDLRWEPDEDHFEIKMENYVIRESVYAYVRVTQEDGNMAWSSPIWIDM